MMITGMAVLAAGALRQGQIEAAGGEAQINGSEISCVTHHIIQNNNGA
jgi:hypothetical protein